MISIVTLPDKYNIYKFQKKEDIPQIVYHSTFYSITQTKEEISVVTNILLSSGYIESNTNWKGFMVNGVLDFSLVGIIHEITKPLKENQISVFVISTYNTDYILVKEESFIKAIEVLNKHKSLNLIIKL